MKKPAITILFLFIAMQAFAQSGGFSGASMRVGFGPRGLAMGNSLTATTHQGIYAYYNPALAAANRSDKQFDLSVASLAFDRKLQTLSASLSLPPNAGISIYFTHAGVDNIDGRTPSGFHTGSLSTNEYQIATAFGLRLSDKVYGGFGLKLNMADLNDDLDQELNFGIDLGFLAQLTNKINLGITIQDLISEYTFNSANLYGQNQAQNLSNSFPTRIKFAGAYETEKWVFATEFELRVQQSDIIERDVFVFDGRPTFIDESLTINTNSTMIRFGGAYDIHERFTLRGGYRFTDLKSNGSGSISSGFSLHLPFDNLSPSIDYAFVVEPYQISNMHVFAIRLNL